MRPLQVSLAWLGAFIALVSVVAPTGNARADIDSSAREAARPALEESVEGAVRPRQSPGRGPEIGDRSAADAARRELEQLAPRRAIYDTGFFTGTGFGEVLGTVVPVDLALGDPASSTSGCEETDFDGLDLEGPNDIALVQRGACFFSVKASLAEQAGAEAIVIINQGNTPVRRGPVSGSAAFLPSGASSDIGIPMVGAAFGVGEALSQSGSIARVRIDPPEDDPLGDTKVESPGISFVGFFPSNPPRGSGGDEDPDPSIPPGGSGGDEDPDPSIPPGGSGGDADPDPSIPPGGSGGDEDPDPSIPPEGLRAQFAYAVGGGLWDPCRYEAPPETADPVFYLGFYRTGEFGVGTTRNLWCVKNFETSVPILLTISAPDGRQTVREVTLVDYFADVCVFVCSLSDSLLPVDSTLLPSSFDGTRRVGVEFNGVAAWIPVGAPLGDYRIAAVQASSSGDREARSEFRVSPAPKPGVGVLPITGSMRRFAFLVGHPESSTVDPGLFVLGSNSILDHGWIFAKRLPEVETDERGEAVFEIDTSGLDGGRYCVVTASTIPAPDADIGFENAHLDPCWNGDGSAPYHATFIVEQANLAAGSGPEAAGRYSAEPTSCTDAPTHDPVGGSEGRAGCETDPARADLEQTAAVSDADERSAPKRALDETDRGSGVDLATQEGATSATGSGLEQSGDQPGASMSVPDGDHRVARTDGSGTERALDQGTTSPAIDDGEDRVVGQDSAAEPERAEQDAAPDVAAVPEEPAIVEIDDVAAAESDEGEV